ncbi:ATP-binding cassette domain-containing protein [bacterium]|nr:ATP-binding cassette domain-containing protein [bacterium]
MTITVSKLTKRFNRNVIFSDMSCSFPSNSISAILGPNGSGKSTFLRVLAAQLEPDEGSLHYPEGMNSHNAYQELGFVAPYIDIPEEFSFDELLTFHKKFKSSVLSNDEIIDRCHLLKFRHTAIKEYSSGMKQRVKLSLNLFFDLKLYLFDEPCSHLDKEGFQWFNEHVQALTKKGIVVIGSNNENEYRHAQQLIDIQHFKKNGSISANN